MKIDIEIQYKGDPLQDFGAMNFFDRFVYRNPKKKFAEASGKVSLLIFPFHFLSISSFQKLTIINNNNNNL